MRPAILLVVNGVVIGRAENVDAAFPVLHSYRAAHPHAVVRFQADYPPVVVRESRAAREARWAQTAVHGLATADWFDMPREGERVHG